MKNKSIIMGFSLALLNIADIYSSEFDISFTTDQIVGKLWAKQSVPEEKVVALFEFLDKDKNNSHKASPEEIKEISQEFKELLTEINAGRGSDENAVTAINNFVNTVNSIGEQFPLKVIETSLMDIADKY